MRGRERWAVRVVLLLGLLLTCSGTASAATKLYSLSVSTASPSYDSQSGVTGSGQTVTVTAKIVNESTTQQLGSANLFPPSSAFDANFQNAPDGFQLQGIVAATVVGGPALTACSSSSTGPCYQTAANCTDGSFSAPCAELRGLSLPPGTEVDVSLRVQTPPCEGSPSGTGFAWTAEVKQANDFSGVGNDIPLDTGTSRVDTLLDGACSLAFVAEPHDALTGTTITDTDWSATGGPVTVGVLAEDGSQVATSTAPVTVGLASNLGGATLSGDTTEPAGATGLASFTALSVNLAGQYTMQAASGALANTTSDAFTVSDTLASCTAGVTCQASDGTADGNQATVSATTTADGFLLESVNVNQRQLTCAGYTSADPNTYDSFATVAASKVITTTIKNPSAAAGLPSNPKQALKQQQICFGATTDFLTASGKMAPAGTLPDGTQGYIGLLPACSNKTTGPCHNRQQDTWVADPTRKLGYDLILVLDIPAGFRGDPFHC